MQDIQPNAAGTYYYRAAATLLDGHLDEALSLARLAVATDPKYAAAHILLGTVYGNLGRQEEARIAFQAALQLDGRDPAAYVNLGLLELASGNRTISADRFVEALLLDPGSAVARAGLAQARGEPEHRQP